MTFSPCGLCDLLFSIVLTLLEQGCMTLGTPLLSLEQGCINISMPAFLNGGHVVISAIQNDNYRDSNINTTETLRSNSTFVNFRIMFWVYGPIWTGDKIVTPLL